MEHTCLECLESGEIILTPAAKITLMILMVPYAEKF